MEQALTPMELTYPSEQVVQLIAPSLLNFPCGQAEQPSTKGEIEYEPAKQPKHD
jgi:hypothetical protein